MDINQRKIASCVEWKIDGEWKKLWDKDFKTQSQDIRTEESIKLDITT